MTGSLMTPDQVAERLAVPVSTVYRLIRRRDLAAHNIAALPRRIYRVSESQLEEFLQARIARSA